LKTLEQLQSQHISADIHVGAITAYCHLQLAEGRTVAAFVCWFWWGREDQSRFVTNPHLAYQPGCGPV